MLEIAKVPQTASMNDIKNRTMDVLKKFVSGPVLLMNRATPQAILVSPEQWSSIVDMIDDMQDTIATLQAELEIAMGQSQVKTVDNPDDFMQEMMGTNGSLQA